MHRTGLMARRNQANAVLAQGKIQRQIGPVNNAEYRVDALVAKHAGDDIAPRSLVHANSFLSQRVFARSAGR